MRQILLAAMLAIGGLLATAATAVADVGDIGMLSIDDELFGDADTVEVSGKIRCTSDIVYGLSVKVSQPADTDNDPAGDSSAEGVGAFGPNVQGAGDDQPCTTSLTDYDVVVQRGRGSGPFSDSGDDAPPGNIGVEVLAGTSAEDGVRGPGPIVGDLESVARDDLSFRRR